jgi:hypothetical protein
VISSFPHDQHDPPFAKRPELFEHLGNEIPLTRGWPNTYAKGTVLPKKIILRIKAPKKKMNELKS